MKYLLKTLPLLFLAACGGISPAYADTNVRAMRPADVARFGVFKVDTVATVAEGGSRYNLQELQSTDLGIRHYGSDDLGAEVSIQVLGYYLDSNGDPDGVFEGQGIYKLVHDETLTANGGTIIAGNFSFDSDSSANDAFWLLIDTEENELNVKHFGARGDGSTDDATAIQLAADALTSGGTLMFPRGTYNSTAAIDLLSDTTVMGENGATVQYAPSPNIDGVGPEFFDCDGISDIRIQNLKAGRGGLVSARNGASNIRISHCEVDGKYVDTGAVTRAGGSLIEVVDYASDIFVESCRVIDAKTGVALAQNQTTNGTEGGRVEVRDSWFENTIEKFSANTADPAPVGVYNYNLSDLTVIDCTFKNIRDDPSVGADGHNYAIYTGDPVAVLYARPFLLVENCRFIDDDTVGTGLPMTAFSPRIEQHCEIRGCYAQYDAGNKGDFIQAITSPQSDQPRSLTIDSCKIINGGGYINDAWGSIHITNTEFFETDGLIVGDGTDDIDLCMIDGVKVYGAEDYAMLIRGDFNNCVVQNCIIYDANKSNSTTSGQRGALVLQGINSGGVFIARNNYAINTTAGGGRAKYVIEDQLGGYANAYFENNYGALIETSLYLNGPNSSNSNFPESVPLTKGMIALDPYPGTSGNNGTYCDYSAFATLSATEASGQTVLSVSSASSLTLTEVAIELDNGDLHITTISAKSTSPHEITIADSLPSNAASGNRVWNWRVVNF